MRLALAALLALSAAPLWAQDAGGTDEVGILRAARDDLLGGRVDEAIAVLKPAAEAGNARAQTYYGSTFDYGDAGVFDGPEAIRWYEMAAAQGYPEAMTFLGDIYKYGGADGQVAADPAKAREWYEKAIALDHPAAFGQLADMLVGGLGLPEDYDTGLLYARRGASAGDSLSNTILGRGYLNGWYGLPADDESARQYLLVGAAGGNMKAQNDMAILLSNGRGGPVDLPLARQFYLASVAQGYDLAAKNVAEFLQAHPDQASGLASPEAYCAWAISYATEKDGPNGQDAFCEGLLKPLTSDQLREADRQAQELIGTP